mgnify:CR=1 FL=1
MDNSQPLYRQLADSLEEAIKVGTIVGGQRLPSVRALARSEGISISTALSVYRDLEHRGMVEARPKSGYFARASCCLPALEPLEPDASPVQITTTGLMRDFTREASEFRGVAFGAALPSHKLLPVRELGRAVTATMHREGNESVALLEPLGLPALRQVVAARMLNAGCRVAPEEIVITNGCSEALSLALQVCTRPGDVVAVECPSFYGTLLAIHGLGRQVLEIKTCPKDGLSVEAFEQACRKAPPRVLVVSPSVQNPTGACMSEASKLRLLEIAAEYGVTIIEDDVFGELAREGGSRPWALKSRAQDADVIYCSSFSKILSPGFRLGWIVPGRYLEAIRSTKIVQTWGGPGLLQRSVVRMLHAGSLENRIRQLVKETDATRRKALAVIDESFPQGVAVANSQYGYLLWLRLPGHVDSMPLYHQAAKRLGVNFAPGVIFSATGQFSDHLRLNLGFPWNDGVELALRQLGALLCEAYG